VTSGGGNGTSGWPRGDWQAWLSLIPVGLVVVVVNATSNLMEAQQNGRSLQIWEPFVWELSSLVFFLALAPLVGLAVERVPPRSDNLLRFISFHGALTLPFSLVHVTAMVALRKLVYVLVGQNYEFTHGRPLLTFVYEWRKDVITYAIIAAVYYGFDRWRRQRAPVKADERIEIRDGATAVFLPPSDILYVEAAGNYVQFHTAARAHLVRGTLATWEAKLAPRGFVRAHRSRIINRAHVSALKPTPAGDVEITLDTGATVLGSRRYRDGLETA